MKDSRLVSIIMPAYNCAKYIGETIESVLEQTYDNWELVIVDDNSSDNTEDVIKEYIKSNKKIVYYKLTVNSGAAAARNKAMELASGTYYAFLDSDDIWFPEKLEQQISFMKRSNAYFSCTAYTKIDEEGNSLERIIVPADKISYSDLLKACPGNSTVMFDTTELGKYTIPDIRKRNDYILWLMVIKEAGFLHGLKKPLASHRVRSNSVSSNKISLLKYHWRIYRHMEGISWLKSCYLILYWVIATVFRLR